MQSQSLGLNVQNYNPASTYLGSYKPGGFQEAIPMTVARTTRKPADEKPKPKTVEDLEFKPIEIEWTVDWDILATHAQILKYMDTLDEKRTILETHIKILKSTNMTTLSTNEICNLKVKLERYKKQLEDLNKITTRQYMSAVARILDEYKKLAAPVIQVLGQKPKIDNSLVIRKSEVVEKYFNIASKFCPLDVRRSLKLNTNCKQCSGKIIDGGENMVCAECGSIQKKTEIYSEKMENDDAPPKRSINEHGQNIKDAFSQYRCTYPVAIPEKVLDSIRATIASYPSLNIKKLTKMDLYKIMKELNMGIWYKHLHKVHNLITSIPPTELSAYVDNFNLRADLFGEIYDSVKPKDRSNLIHTVYLIWQFLKNEGFEPNIEDFPTLKSRDVELNNISITEEAFKVLRASHPEHAWVVYPIP